MVKNNFHDAPTLLHANQTPTHSSSPPPSPIPPGHQIAPPLPPTRFHFQPGDKLGKYEVLGMLSADGGMGDVYVARHPLGWKVAIKVVKALCSGKEFEELLEGEAILTARLGRNPRFITIHDLDRLPSGQPYLVMELLVGRTLKEHLQTERNLEHILKLFLAILEGMAYAHQRGIVHRDLKPENVFVSDEDEIKILDLGLSRLYIKPDRSSLMNLPKAINVTAGTLLYMPAESWNGDEPTPKVDVWAIGVMIYEALNQGQHPYWREGMSWQAYGLRLAAPGNQEMNAFGAYLPRAIVAVVHKALALDPAHRYKDAAEMRNALQAALPSNASPAPAKIPNSEPTDRIGKLVGNYRLVRLLSTGRLASVYEGRRENESAEQVAIKIFNGAVSEQNHWFRRVVTARQAVAHFAHPGIVQIFEYGRLLDGNLYMIMEYIEGLTLRALMSNNRLSVERALDLVKQIASALDSGHRIGIVHRNITPEKILVVKDGVREKTKLLDFGSERMLSNEAGGWSLHGPLYESPEQQRDVSIATDRSDIYSLGIVLYEMLAGKPPLGIEKRQAPIAIEGVPYEVNVFLDRMLARASLSRPSAVDIEKELERLLYIFERRVQKTRKTESPKPLGFSFEVTFPGEALFYRPSVDSHLEQEASSNTPSPITPGLIQIDSRPLLKEKGSTWTQSFYSSSSVQDFLNELFLHLPHVPSFSYGSYWVLRNPHTGCYYTDMGSGWAAKHLQKTNDTRLLEEIGIGPGMTLEVVPARVPKTERITLKIGNIVNEDVDAIVTSSNIWLIDNGRGVNSAIHRAAGPKFTEECAQLGGCQVGEAKITIGHDLTARYVVHTVGPVWQGGNTNEDILLRQCYENCLAVAERNNLVSIAFPAISTGAFGFPGERAARIALATIRTFLRKNHRMHVYLICFQNETYFYYLDAFNEPANCPT